MKEFDRCNCQTHLSFKTNNFLLRFQVSPPTTLSNENISTTFSNLLSDNSDSLLHNLLIIAKLNSFNLLTVNPSSLVFVKIVFHLIQEIFQISPPYKKKMTNRFKRRYDTVGEALRRKDRIREDTMPLGGLTKKR